MFVNTDCLRQPPRYSGGPGLPPSRTTVWCLAGIAVSTAACVIASVMLSPVGVITAFSVGVASAGYLVVRG